MTVHEVGGGTIIQGDCLETLRLIPDRSIQCCVTSPPYWGLRDYGKEGQLGLEATPEEYVAKMVAVFREVKRVLRDDGTLWLNLGDSYAANRSYQVNSTKGGPKHGPGQSAGGKGSDVPDGLKPKDLVGIPWSLAKGLQQPYYAGRIKVERDRVWLAAIIDGEGCFFIHKRKAGTPSYSKFTRADGSEANYERTADTYGVGLEICNTNKAIIDRVQEIVPGGTITTQSPQQNARRKQIIYRWRVAPNEAKRIAQELYPHFVGKQRQARLIFNCPSNGDAGAAAHQAMMDLHNGVNNSVDYPEPPTIFEPGWYLRQDCIWSKPNCMPESVRDRCTKSHEYIFLLSKSERYYFDQEAIKEPSITNDTRKPYAPGQVDKRGNGHDRGGGKQRKPAGWDTGAGSHGTIHRDGRAQDVEYTYTAGSTRIKRSVWTVTTKPFKGAHFATFPPDLIEPCILAGTSEKGACPHCGAGWKRVVEKGAPDLEHQQACGGDANGEYDGESTKDYANAGAQDASATKARILAGMVAKVTTGWVPSCKCPPHEPAPCFVLDPFAGAGTVGLMANKHGHKSILLELNPEYCQIAANRLAGVK